MTQKDDMQKPAKETIAEKALEAAPAPAPFSLSPEVLAIMGAMVKSAVSETMAALMPKPPEKVLQGIGDVKQPFYKTALKGYAVKEGEDWRDIPQVQRKQYMQNYILGRWKVQMKNRMAQQGYGDGSVVIEQG